ncbi:hypothetical protein LJR231_003495 [Phyllobacterium sp. LjRoot231]|uniref:hypothetical protein n=1 Tax=Phyllobacterium sp. LjRoot231 TaxID=3342289 RepID=UPI003ED0C0C6
MNAPSHTPTPWHLASASNKFIADAEGIIVARASVHAITSHDYAADNAKHIVKCVNAHDDLLNALIDCADYFDGCSDADFDGDTFVANKEMRLKMMIDELLTKIGGAK